MTSEKICYRSDLLGTQVITRDTGKRLGVVNQLWVDIDQREVVAIGLRDNLLTGLIAGIPRYMLLSSIRQIGDVILVDDDSAIIDLDAEAYNSLIRNEVVTETGELLGRVHGFRFDIDDGKISALIVSSLGFPQIPEKLISTYELPVDEIVSSGPDRLIVFEGAEERLSQITEGILEKFGLGKPPWEREEADDYLTPIARPENQLGTGVPLRTPTQQSLRTVTPVQERWNENDWEEEERQPPPKPARLQRAEPVYYPEEEEEENWSEAVDRDNYDADYEEDDDYDYDDEIESRSPEETAYTEAYDEDVWADEEPQYQPPKVNLPEKMKTPEYEEEGGY
ncbi:photosystem reaction center subunit H [Neosynechococcus sphagnicola sy1]|uniref:Photosystem reaction center subunit H n=1 Tax=Neosynechococcus sphagnicola sy1 TaxID=1497020 RepID=A0A098TLU0_9CYAN|nr:PRC-barrel domain-containing protein [Neosynechococcus sphagnicola]KGF72837.1 photosystem reaction center subunit H [Neosynechococcus sphagnicola sy1]